MKPMKKAQRTDDDIITTMNTTTMIMAFMTHTHGSVPSSLNNRQKQSTMHSSNETLQMKSITRNDGTSYNRNFLPLMTHIKNNWLTKQKDVIIVTHAAFGYLADRYGFHQHGVIGLSADEQPSASTIAALVNTMIDQEIYVVYVDPVYSDSYAQTLKNTLESKTNQSVQILRLYLMSGEIDGLDYFTQLERNLQNLKIGLQAS
jgi:hypothetical protein